MKFPTISEVSALIRAIKPDIDDDYVDEPGDTPSIQLTIGHDPESGAWNYQTGDNSFSGGAYLYPNWAVDWVTRRCNSRETARRMIDELRDLAAQ